MASVRAGLWDRDSLFALLIYALSLGTVRRAKDSVKQADGVHWADHDMVYWYGRFDRRNADLASRSDAEETAQHVCIFLEYIRRGVV